MNIMKCCLYIAASVLSTLSLFVSVTNAFTAPSASTKTNTPAILSSTTTSSSSSLSPIIQSSSARNARSSALCMSSAIDPTTITKKEYEDILGTDFEDSDAYYHKQQYLYPKHVEVVEDIAPIADKMVDEILLETGENSWQPQDYLPDMSRDDWIEQLKEVKEMSSGISDAALIVLVGDLVTEEALPTYQTLLNTFEGCDDPSGASDTAWAKWSRGWTSEENRHGDLLNKYLYLTGRVDMRSVEVTIQHLITSGFDPKAAKDPYRGFCYTSFQERATKISHGNVAKVVKQDGDALLQKICARIAGDEARHERAYQLFSQEVLNRDPNGFMKVLGDMMRGQIVMPAEQMTDGSNPNLYTDFSEIAQRLGVYTAFDYADILEHLVKRWDLGQIEGLSPEGEKEQQYICRLPDRYRKLATRSMNKKKKATEDVIPDKVAFDWIFGREV